MINLLKSFLHVSFIQHPAVTGDLGSSAFWMYNQLLLWSLPQFLALRRKIIWLNYKSLRSDTTPSDLKLWQIIEPIHSYNNQIKNAWHQLQFYYSRIHFRLTKRRNDIVSLSFLPVSFVSSYSQSSIRKFCIWIAKTLGNLLPNRGRKTQTLSRRHFYPFALPLKLFNRI